MWGDGALWYKLAEANPGIAGITGPAAALTAGRTLVIPGGVTSTHHSADTFKPYDITEALGNTQPGAPAQPIGPAPPSKKGCGIIGAIILVAIAVAVTIASHGTAAGLFGSLGLGTGTATVGATAAATIGATGIALGSAAGIAGGVVAAVAGSVVSQAFGLATKLQDKFSWKQVALAGVSAFVGGVTGGLGGGNLLGKAAGAFANGAARGVLSNVITQGISVATGLQKKFDWVGVAVGGAVGGVSGALQGHFEGVNTAAGASFISRSVEDYAQQTLTGAAAAVAGGAARSLITGTDFGDNVLAALPDVIGSTIGGMIARGVAATPRKAASPGGGNSQGGVAGSWGIGAGGGTAEGRFEGFRYRPGQSQFSPLGRTSYLLSGSANYGGGGIFERAYDRGSKYLGAASNGDINKIRQLLSQDITALTTSASETYNDAAQIVVNGYRAATSSLSAAYNQTADRVTNAINTKVGGVSARDVFNVTSNIVTATENSISAAAANYVNTQSRNAPSVLAGRVLAQIANDNGYPRVGSALNTAAAYDQGSRQAFGNFARGNVGGVYNMAAHPIDTYVGVYRAGAAAGNYLSQGRGQIGMAVDAGVVIGSAVLKQNREYETTRRTQGQYAADVMRGEFYARPVIEVGSLVLPFVGEARLATTAGRVGEAARVGFIAAERTFLSVDEFARLPKTGLINPSLIRFSQDSAKATFKPPFGSVDDFATGLANKSINPSSISPIRIVEKDGMIFTLDNRRLYAFQKAGVEIPYRKLDAIPNRQLTKFTTVNDGTSILIRGNGN